MTDRRTDICNSRVATEDTPLANLAHIGIVLSIDSSPLSLDSEKHSSLASQGRIQNG